MELQDLSTDALVQMVREGQVACFDVIIKRYQLDVLKRVNLLLKDRAAVEDIVQEVFFRAYVHLDQYHIATSFRKWLLGIAQNAVLQEFRRSNRYGGRLVRYARVIEERFRVSGDEPEDDRVQDLMGCLSGLNATTADMVRARYAERLTLDQIAESAGRTVAAVRTFLYRARSQLRECLERKGAWR